MGIGPLKSITWIYANVYIEHWYRSFEVNNQDLCQRLHRTWVGPLKSITRIHANVCIEHGYRSCKVNELGTAQLQLVGFEGGWLSPVSPNSPHAQLASVPGDRAHSYSGLQGQHDSHV